MQLYRQQLFYLSSELYFSGLSVVFHSFFESLTIINSPKSRMASSPEARDSDSPTIIPPRLSDVPISEPSALPVSLAHKVNDRNDQQATHPSTSVGMSEIEDSSAKRRPHPLPVDNISQSVPHTEQFSTPASTPLGPLAHEPGSTHPTANSESMQANPINESSSDRQTFSDSAPHLSVNIPSQTSPITPTFTTPTEPSDVLTSGENQNRNAEMQQSLGHSQEASSQHQMQDLSGHSRSLQKRPEQPDELQRGRDRATLSRLDSTTPIGPSIENPQVQPDPSAGPAVLITLLLTTGARHPFKIDRKYLSKRGIHRAAAMGGGKTQDGAASGDTAEKKADTERADVPDPLNISVYTMKELIWRDWRDGRLSLMNA